jgi:phosphatidate cytidylyltransferase
VRQRAISSIGVVLIGLVPALLGGWIFAVAFTAIAAFAYHEAIAMTLPHRSPVRYCGLAVVGLAGILATTDTVSNGFPLIAGLAVGLPLAAAVFLSQDHGIEHWTATTATTLYLAIPVYAALDLRGDTALPARDWIRDLAGLMPDTGTDTGGGLAWFLLALLVTWLSDTFAYLVGKTWGRHKLIPRVSPNKTIEGAIGGLAAAALTAMLCDIAFGMEIGAPLALVIGAGLGAVGMVGDLSESMIKRMRGVKDSGTLIPGHGGILDRIDALIFVIVTAWLIAPHIG